MKNRTTQDLLAERRYNILERNREKDKMGRAMLQAHIDTLSVEISVRIADINALERAQS